MARTGKNTWSLFLLLLAGIVLGSFIAHLTAGVSALSWLSYGKTFGLSSPIVLDLGVLVLTFGLTIKFTIASIIGIIIAAIIYRLLSLLPTVRRSFCHTFEFFPDFVLLLLLFLQILEQF